MSWLCGKVGRRGKCSGLDDGCQPPSAPDSAVFRETRVIPSISACGLVAGYQPMHGSTHESSASNQDIARRFGQLKSSLTKRGCAVSGKRHDSVSASAGDVAICPCLALQRVLAAARAGARGSR